MAARPELKQEPRPSATCEAVIARAVLEVIDDLAPWIERWVSISLPTTEIAARISNGIQQVGPDGYRLASFMHDYYAWPVDMEACLIFHRICQSLPAHRRREVHAWVMRTGYRFPAKAGDVIEWWVEDRIRHGTVYAVVDREAAAVVRPHVGIVTALEAVKVEGEQVCGIGTEQFLLSSDRGPVT